jgi:glycosyltransferase involved in cell wall biosynthesis
MASRLWAYPANSARVVSAGRLLQCYFRSSGWPRGARSPTRQPRCRGPSLVTRQPRTATHGLRRQPLLPRRQRSVRHCQCVCRSTMRPESMLTVLIATYNGAETLPEALSAYCALEPPDGGWKLVIVDNGSTDYTKEIIAPFHHRLPLNYLCEPKQGKNAALNMGLSNISGDLVVLTDDDVLPQPDWLRQIRLGANAQPSFSIFGGPILPKWERPPDDWILAWVPLGPTFTILDSLEEGPIHPRLVFGPNMAVRTDIFHSGYRFDETIGPKGPNYAMGSEAEFLRRLANAGFKAWHCKSAVVHHIVRSFQMTKEWVLARAVRYGRGQYRLAAKELPKLPASLWGVPVSLRLQILVQRLRLGCATLSRDAETLFRVRWELNFLNGKAVEARLLSKDRGSQTGKEHESARHASGI